MPIINEGNVPFADRSELPNPLPHIFAKKGVKHVPKANMAPASSQVDSSESPENMIKALVMEVKKEVEQLSKEISTCLDLSTEMRKIVSKIATKTTTAPAVAEPVIAKVAPVSTASGLVIAKVPPISSYQNSGDELEDLFDEVASGLAPAVEKVVTPVAPATVAPAKAVVGKKVTAMPLPKEPWEKISYRFASAVKTIREAGMNHDVLVQGDHEEGYFFVRPDAVVMIKDEQSGTYRHHPNVWTKVGTKSYEVISYRKKKTLAREEKNKRRAELIEKGFDSNRAKGLANSEAQLMFIPLAIYAAAEHLNKEAREVFDLESVRERIRHTLNGIQREAKKSKPKAETLPVKIKESPVSPQSDPIPESMSELQIQLFGTSEEHVSIEEDEVLLSDAVSQDHREAEIVVENVAPVLPLATIQEQALELVEVKNQDHREALAEAVGNNPSASEHAGNGGHSLGALLEATGQAKKLAPSF